MALFHFFKEFCSFHLSILSNNILPIINFSSFEFYTIEIKTFYVPWKMMGLVNKCKSDTLGN